jgi:hypothetical protein
LRFLATAATVAISSPSARISSTVVTVCRMVDDGRVSELPYAESHVPPLGSGTRGSRGEVARRRAAPIPISPVHRGLLLGCPWLRAILVVHAIGPETSHLLRDFGSYVLRRVPPRRAEFEQSVRGCRRSGLK